MDPDIVSGSILVPDCTMTPGGNRGQSDWHGIYDEITLGMHMVSRSSPDVRHLQSL